MRIRIKVTAYAEDHSPEKAEKDAAKKGTPYAPGFAKAVRRVQAECRKKNINDIWGWCRIVVRATIRTKGQKYSAVSHIGQCSYVGKDDFIANSGYYEDLLGEVIEEALREWREYVRPKVASPEV